MIKIEYFARIKARKRGEVCVYMQELKRAEKLIINYLNEFKEHEKIVEDICKTADISEYIARKLLLDEKNIGLARVIALLHRVGNFEREKYTEQDNFISYGIKVLFDYNLIRKFIFESDYDEIIKKVIRNYNENEIKEDMTELELLHTKILHDASKIGALDFFIKDAENTDLRIVELIEKLKETCPDDFKDAPEDYESISNYAYEDFMNNRCIKLLDRQTKLDYWLDYLAIIFELNLEASLQYVKDNNYVDTVIDRFTYKDAETKEKIEQIRKYAKEYVEKSIDK